MLALYKPTSAPGLELTERPEHQTGDHEVKIRVLRTGICGTDLHIESWDAWSASTLKPPIIPGHEFFGEVVEVGSDVRDVHVGARVSGEGHIVCGICRNCRAGRRHMCIRAQGIGVNRDGAFAEYVVLPESNVWVHQNDIDPDLGSIFDPFGNAVHTALSFPLVGEDVLITGAGPIGLMAAAVARHVGARFVVVTDVSEPRLALARRMGADLTVNVTKSRIADAQRTLGMLEGFDVGFDVLAGLRRNGVPYELSPGQLLPQSLVTSGTMTNRIDRLEKLGFVERRPEPNDGRGILVRLTATGKEVVDAALDDLLTSEEGLLAELPKADRIQLAQMLCTVLAPFDSANQPST